MALEVSVIVLAVLAIAMTVLPFLPTSAGLVRSCGFPRPQVLVAAIFALAGLIFIFNWQSWVFWLLVPALAMAITVQLSRILPYTPLVRKQTQPPQTVHKLSSFSLLIANVKQDNRQADALLKLIEAFDPDLLFFVEIDKWWEKKLKRVATRYEHATVVAQQDGYGLMFLSRLRVESCELRRLVRPEIPSVKARLVLPSGSSFLFYGIHPEPPGLMRDVEDRDAELSIIAREMRDDGEPSIVAGDLNDVAWSQTTRGFQRISGALDPRYGRGFYATFHADYWFARWPIDHLFHSCEFFTENLAVLPHTGSDHFPVFGRLCFMEGNPGER